MLRLDIISEDRVGMTQEILSVFGQEGWDLKAMEMEPHHTYVCADVPTEYRQDLQAQLMGVQGVTGVKYLDLLPSEHRRQHLDALLSRLPDPILDIDRNGMVLVANKAAALALTGSDADIENVSLDTLLDVDLSRVLSHEEFSTEIHTADGAYLFEATPVLSKKRLDGAVIVLRSINRVGQQLSAVRSEVNEGVNSIIGESQAINSVRQQAVRFASLNLPVLIQGETGTGKELFAKALHFEGDRRSGPFLAINCATLSENLLESELFGYAPGAFSGAQKTGKPGLFELANKGTVFLDEVGEMSVYLQAKLLRFLEDYSFRRIGGNREIKVSIRIVCATHRNLQEMVEKKLFREDLYYRLNVLNLHIPSLRERLSDLRALVPHFLQRACEQTGRELVTIAPQAQEQITRVSWPGNVRQLQNTLFKAVALTESSVITSLDDYLLKEPTGNDAHAIDTPDNLESLDVAMANYERQLLTSMYSSYPSSRKLARRLQVSHANIARKLKKYNIAD